MSTTTWIDVVDSAVKIGLGAAIGGVVSFGLVFAGMLKETVQDRRKRRLKHIEDALTSTEFYFNYMISHASTTAWHWASDLDADERARIEREYAKSRAGWDQALDRLNSATTKLLLTGSDDAVELLREASKIADSALRTIETEGTCAEQIAKFESFRRDVGAQRSKVIKSLRRAYNVEGEVERTIGPIL